MRSAWALSFIGDEALSRGAAISFYTATSIAPILLIVNAVAGLAVGREAAQNGITAQPSGLMGQQTADVLQNAITSAAGKKAGTLATVWNHHFGRHGLGRVWRNAVGAQCNLEGQATRHHLVAFNSGPRSQPGLGGCAGISTRGERHAYGLRQLPQLSAAIWQIDFSGAKCRHFLSPALYSVRPHL
jgi:hypothetical protein